MGALFVEVRGIRNLLIFSVVGKEDTAKILMENYDIQSNNQLVFSCSEKLKVLLVYNSRENFLLWYLKEFFTLEKSCACFVSVNCVLLWNFSNFKVCENLRCFIVGLFCKIGSRHNIILFTRILIFKENENPKDFL